MIQAWSTDIMSGEEYPVYSEHITRRFSPPEAGLTKYVNESSVDIEFWVPDLVIDYDSSSSD